MLTEVVTRAPEACDQKMARDSADKQVVGSTVPQRAWKFNAALAGVAGMLACSAVVNKPGAEDAMLQLYAGGTVPSIGEKHHAFVADCFPWESLGGMFAVQDPVPARFVKRRPGVWSRSGRSWRRPIRGA